jgi:hypothetical protein
LWTLILKKRAKFKNVISTTGPVNSRVVRMPRYKNVVQSFVNRNRAAKIVELYLSLLYHYSAGLS